MSSNGKRLGARARESGLFAERDEPAEALELLGRNINHPSHQFRADDIGLLQAVKSFGDRIIGHRQTSDAYFVGSCDS